MKPKTNKQPIDRREAGLHFAQNGTVTFVDYGREVETFYPFGFKSAAQQKTAEASEPLPTPQAPPQPPARDGMSADHKNGGRGQQRPPSGRMRRKRDVELVQG